MQEFKPCEDKLSVCYDKQFLYCFLMYFSQVNDDQKRNIRREVKPEEISDPTTAKSKEKVHYVIKKQFLS